MARPASMSLRARAVIDLSLCVRWLRGRSRIHNLRLHPSIRHRRGSVGRLNDFLSRHYYSLFLYVFILLPFTTTINYSHIYPRQLTHHHPLATTSHYHTLPQTTTCIYESQAARRYGLIDIPWAGRNWGVGQPSAALGNRAALVFWLARRFGAF